MATCCKSQTGVIFVLLAISKPCIRFRWSLYRCQPKSPHLSSGTLGFPCWGQVQSFLSKSCICIIYLIVHHAMIMLVCLPCCLLLSCLLLSLASVSFRSCEHSFDYVRLSSSWTRSSSLRDFRQDDRHFGSHYYHCYASCFVLSLCCATYHLFIEPSLVAMNL